MFKDAPIGGLTGGPEKTYKPPNMIHRHFTEIVDIGKGEERSSEQINCYHGEW